MNTHDLQTCFVAQEPKKKMKKKNRFRRLHLASREKITTYISRSEVWFKNNILCIYVYMYVKRDKR